MYNLIPANANANASAAAPGASTDSAPSGAAGAMHPGGTFAVNDGVRSAYPAMLGDGSSAPPVQGGFLGLMQAMIDKISALMASLSGGGALGGGAQQTGDPAEKGFTRFAGSSVGDPHESVDAALADGSSLNGKWDSMTSHRHLLQSDSFDGGYNVSTQVGAPDAHGVTTNASASIALAGGGTNVTMNKDGSYAVSQNGSPRALTAGQAVQLGGGASALLNQDGSLTVAAQNSAGGTLSTTLRSTGGGVDVTTSGSNVDLGGFLIDKSEDAASTSSSSSSGATPDGGLGYLGGTLDPGLAPLPDPAFNWQSGNTDASPQLA